MAVSLRALPWTHGMRAVGCAAVLGWHALLTVLPDNASASEKLYVLPLGVLARESLLMFIVLSGYLLGRHWTGGLSEPPTWPRFRRYLGRRLWRIVPPFWVAVTLTIVVMLTFGLDHAEGSHWDSGLPLTAWRAVANYLLLTDVVGIFPLNHPLWTVPVELHLYLAAPFVIALATRGRVIAVAALAVALLAISLPAFTAPYFIFAFSAAFWTGAHRQRTATTSLRETMRLIAPIAALSLLLVVVVTGTHALPDGPNKYFVADALCAPPILAWLFHRDVSERASLLVRMLGVRPLVWLGERSYSIYLVHALALEMAWRFITRPMGLHPKELHMLVLAVIGAMLSVIAAEILYRLVEAPSARRSATFGRARTIVVGGAASPSVAEESR